MTKEHVEQNQPLVGRVAMVLNERELAINIGASSGVEVGMKFKVLADEPTEILDPETDESLGSIDREKVRVQAREVQERFSICRTYVTRRINGGPFYGLTGMSTSLARLYAPPREVPETLKAEDSSLLPPLSEKESYVKKGDRVVQLIEKTA
jgi:hypothetical protein